MSNLTHLTPSGQAKMVDVGDKAVTRRHATAEGFVRISRALAEKIQSNAVAKGNLLDVARVAGIMAAKRTDALIPMCHSLPLDGIDIGAQVVERESGPAVHITATARVEAKTGVEMEAFTAVAVAALTVVDMGKAVDPGMVIEGVRLLEKGGGKKGHWKADPGSAGLRTGPGSAALQSGAEGSDSAGVNTGVPRAALKSGAPRLSSGAPKPTHKSDGPGTWHSRGYLPHVDKIEAMQFVTFRLHDALPAAQVDSWKKELGLWESLAHIPSDDPRQVELRRRLDKYEDVGHGACWLKDFRVAELVQNALLHFDGERYQVVSWCIMPNHVHVLVKMMPGYSIQEVVKSWKSYTGRQANELLGRSGEFWMRDYYDRHIRDAVHLSKTIAYIAENPANAGLKDWPWMGVPATSGEKSSLSWK